MGKEKFILAFRITSYIREGYKKNQKALRFAYKKSVYLSVLKQECGRVTTHVHLLFAMAREKVKSKFGSWEKPFWKGPKGVSLTTVWGSMFEVQLSTKCRIIKYTQFRRVKKKKKNYSDRRGFRFASKVS